MKESARIALNWLRSNASVVSSIPPMVKYIHMVVVL